MLSTALSSSSANRVGTGPARLSPSKRSALRGHDFIRTVGTKSLKLGKSLVVSYV